MQSEANDSRPCWSADRYRARLQRSSVQLQYVGAIHSSASLQHAPKQRSGAYDSGPTEETTS